MILSVTMNPSIDIAYYLNNFEIDQVNRITEVVKTSGGKGLNVARVLKCSHSSCIATGFVGGIQGQYIISQLNKEKIPHDFCFIDDESRNCIAILHQGKQTEILENGPFITKEEQNRFLNLFYTLLDDTAIVVLSGSLPKGIETDFYIKLIELANLKHKKVILDCSDLILKQTLLSNSLPFLIKPNLDELNSLLETKYCFSDLNAIVQELKNNILLKNISCVVVTLGQHGAIAKIKNKIFKVSIPKLEIKNPVGSGDATIAGLSLGLLDSNISAPNLLKKGMCFGMLNAIEKQTGFIDIDKYDLFFEHISVEEI